MRGLILLIAVACFGIAVLMGGAAPFGRVALTLGMPDIAMRMFTDPRWRGVALYRAGDFEEAVAVLATAGPEASYNLGNAQVGREKYAAALEAYDLALALREDARAQANFDLVRAFYGGTGIEAESIIKWGEDKEGPTTLAPVARGAARAAGTGDAVTNTGATLGLPELQSREQLGVRRVFDDKFIVASPRWLETLEDVPGAYLAARIAQEYKARKKAGTGQIPEDTEW